VTPWFILIGVFFALVHIGLTIGIAWACWGELRKLREQMKLLGEEGVGLTSRVHDLLRREASRELRLDQIEQQVERQERRTLQQNNQFERHIEYLDRHVNATVEGLLVVTKHLNLSAKLAKDPLSEERPTSFERILQDKTE
jgi:hypothetical protein